MKRSQTIRARLGALGASLAVLSCATVANAHPYASGITVNNGVVQFYMNEGGANVNVVFEDGTTNAMGVLTAGAKTFALGTHTSYQIIATKNGTGSPTQFTTDANFWNAWSSPRGVDVHKSPKNGAVFGRIYISHDQNTAVRQWGLYALTPDCSTNAFWWMGTNAVTGSTATSGMWAPDAAASYTVSPYNTAAYPGGPGHMTIGPDGNLYVADLNPAGSAVWQFGPSFEFTNLVIGPVGSAAGIAAGVHGQICGVAVEGSPPRGT